MKLKRLFGKLEVSDDEIEGLRSLVEPLKRASGAKSAKRVAELSDSMLELYLTTTKESSRRRAIRRMWEVEEWLTAKS